MIGNILCADGVDGLSIKRCFRPSMHDHIINSYFRSFPAMLSQRNTRFRHRTLCLSPRLPMPNSIVGGILLLIVLGLFLKVRMEAAREALA